MCKHRCFCYCLRAAARQVSMETGLEDAFVCAVCARPNTFDLLAPQTGCHCLICESCLTLCAARHWQGQITKLQAAPADSLAGQPSLSRAGVF